MSRTKEGKNQNSALHRRGSLKQNWGCTISFLQMLSYSSMPLSQHNEKKQEAEKCSIPRETGFFEALYIQGNQNTSKWNTGILQGHPHLRTGFHRHVLMSWLLVTMAKRYLRACLRLWFPGRLNLIWLCVRLAFSCLSYAGICAHWIHSISVCGLKWAKKK